MIKRFFVISACLVALIVVLVFPAGAAGIDYNDYITDIRVDGDNDIVTVSIPVTSNRIQFFNYNTGALLYQAFGNDISYTLVAGLDYELCIAPGYPDMLLVDNLPTGTILNYEILIPIRHDFLDIGNVDFSSSVTFIDSLGNWISEIKQSDISFGLLGDTISFSQVLPSIPAGANSFYSWIYVSNFASIDTQDITLTVKSCTLTMSISSLYRLQQQTGKTNVILTEVQKQLADQGKTLDEVLQQQQQTNDQLGDLNDKQDQTNDKLDDIINGDVDSSPPSGGDAVGDLDDAEGQIRDDAQSGLDQGVDVQQSALQILAQYWSAFACVGWIFSKFTDLPFFSGLLYVSFALGITGSILGLGLSISRSGSQSGYRRARSKGG